MPSVLLVGINAKFIHTNLAIRSLKANAGQYKKQIEIAEYTINQRQEEILRGIYAKKPEVIGFSCYLWNAEYVFSLAAELKKILPGVIVFAGGPEVSYHPKEVLQKHPSIDFVMAGEGERTFYRYMEYRQGDGEINKLSDLGGLAYREGGEIYQTTPASEMNLDELVFPYENLQGLENRILYYESMRGCPFSCSYCLSSIDRTTRFKSPEKTEGELDFFLSHKVSQVKFVDRTFNCNHAYAYRIWQYIGEHDNGITNFHFEIAGDLLQEEDFKLFQTFRAGLVQFEIGVQSTNKKTIQAIRRKMDLSQLRENVSRVKQTKNIHQHLDLIAGLPYEDLQSFKNSFNDVYAMKPDQLQLGFLKVLDGSYMHEAQLEYKIQYSNRPPYEVLSTKWLSYEDICQLKRVEEMVEVYYNSLQFTASMMFLEKIFESAFELYQSLGTYYDVHELTGRNHSRLQRYEILWDFGNQRIPGEEGELWREVLTYDLYRRDYVKTPPAFVLPRTDEQKKQIRTFFEQECEHPHCLKAYTGYAARQLYHMIYMGQFTVDMRKLLDKGIIQKCPPYYILFDYSERSPLDHSARELTGSSSGLPVLPE